MRYVEKFNTYNKLNEDRYGGNKILFKNCLFNFLYLNPVRDYTNNFFAITKYFNLNLTTIFILKFNNNFDINVKIFINLDVNNNNRQNVWAFKKKMRTQRKQYCLNQTTNNIDCRKLINFLITLIIFYITSNNKGYLGKSILRSLPNKFCFSVHYTEYMKGRYYRIVKGIR